MLRGSRDCAVALRPGVDSLVLGRFPVGRLALLGNKWKAVRRAFGDGCVCFIALGVCARRHGRVRFICRRD